MSEKLTEESIKQQVKEAREFTAEDHWPEAGYAGCETRLAALCDTVETLLRALEDEVRKSDPFHRSKLSAAAEETVNDIVNDKLESAQRIEEAK